MFEPAVLKTKLDRTLGQLRSDILREAVEIGVMHSIPIYLVGGAVRDLLMGEPVVDLDITVERDASTVAHTLAARLSGRVVSRSQFGTFKVDMAGESVDVVTSRRETYRRPGALPTVSPSSIDDDLRRRDFTINAMALRLAPEPVVILDPCEGQEDIRSRTIRVLHEGSFRDDATRMLRAIRYEQRLSFGLSHETEALLISNISYLDTISSDRLRREMGIIFKEEKASAILLRAARLGLLAALYRHIPSEEALEIRLSTIQASAHARNPRSYLALLAAAMNESQAEGFIQRLKMPPTEARVVRDAVKARTAVASLGTKESPSRIVAALQGLDQHALQVTAVLSQDEASSGLALRYLNEWRHVKPRLNGRDLARLGISQGPRVGLLLERLRDARIEGEISTREEEEAFVRRLASSSPSNGSEFLL